MRQVSNFLSLPSVYFLTSFFRLFLSWGLAAPWLHSNYTGVPPATFTAPLLSSGSMSNEGADWEWAWVHAKVFWEGLQRTYLLSREENGNGLVSEGRLGWESWVKQRWETQSCGKMSHWVNGVWGNGLPLCENWLITYERRILIQQICKTCHTVLWEEM